MTVLEKLKAIFNADKKRIAELENRNTTLSEANLKLNKEVGDLKKKLIKASKELAEIGELVDAANEWMSIEFRRAELIKLMGRPRERPPYMILYNDGNPTGKYAQSFQMSEKYRYVSGEVKKEAKECIS